MLPAYSAVLGFTIVVIALFLAWLGAGVLDYLEWLFLTGLCLTFSLWIPMFDYLQSQLVTFA